MDLLGIGGLAFYNDCFDVLDAGGIYLNENY